ncbi:TIGR04141 family sporadically distributed protein [Actinomadura chokoriensis]|uniref:TIGR04141 family sporadically distributed protein n=1 Tax=Actinomadura chokoriensis TaxID=454156 RepID=UPI0031F8DA34
MAYLLRRARSQRQGMRLIRVRDARIEMYSDPGRTESLGNCSALKWLEATVALDDRSFFLMDGRWYEIGTRYLEAKRGEIEGLIVPDPGFYLPAWEEGWDEKRYNEHVADVLPGALCLDRKGVRTRLHRGNGVEACDVLTRDLVLVHVKRADGSAPLSHLFGQGLVSMETLHTPEGEARFAALVEEIGGGRLELPRPFRPRKVVFAILLKGGERLSASTLFPFSQVTLANVARTIRTRYGVPVEVVGISAHDS